MARTRAEDYDDKRALIFDRAAELFAESGFARASIADLAARCRASKSWIYHYFPSKEAILYGILSDHMATLRATATTVLEGSDPPRAQLRRLLGAFMAIYARAQAKHVVLLNDLGCLLRRVNPALAMRRSLVKPTAMLLFGMLNWTHTWYRPDGALAPEQLAALAGDLFLGGLDALAAGRRIAG